MLPSCVHGLPFSIGKGSIAALKGVGKEHNRSRSEHRGAQGSTMVSKREYEKTCKDRQVLLHALNDVE